MSIYETARQVCDAFSEEDFIAVLKIYESRQGGMETVDRRAVEAILEKYADVPQPKKDQLESYAAILSR